MTTQTQIPPHRFETFDPADTWCKDCNTERDEIPGMHIPTQHTPGPWTYNATAGKHDFAVYPEVTGRDVALVRDSNEANARLIAAAPEMLDAGKEIVNYWDCGDDLENMRAAVELMRAAIAKAEGRDQ